MFEVFQSQLGDAIKAKAMMSKIIGKLPETPSFKVCFNMSRVFIYIQQDSEGPSLEDFNTQLQELGVRLVQVPNFKYMKIDNSKPGRQKRQNPLNATETLVMQ